MNQFLQVQFSHVPGSINDKGDALVNLATSLTLPDEREIQITIGEHDLLAFALDHFDETQETNLVSIFEIEQEAWFSLSTSSMTAYPLTQSKGRSKMTSCKVYI